VARFSETVHCINEMYALQYKACIALFHKNLTSLLYNREGILVAPKIFAVLKEEKES
jgi:hypothetical protein